MVLPQTLQDYLLSSIPGSNLLPPLTSLQAQEVFGGAKKSKPSKYAIIGTMLEVLKSFQDGESEERFALTGIPAVMKPEDLDGIVEGFYTQNGFKRIRDTLSSLHFHNTKEHYLVNLIRFEPTSLYVTVDDTTPVFSPKKQFE